MVTKGEIAHFERFLLLSPGQVFKKPSAAEGSKSVYLRRRVNRRAKRGLLHLLIVTLKLVGLHFLCSKLPLGLHYNNTSIIRSSKTVCLFIGSSITHI